MCRLCYISHGGERWSASQPHLKNVDINGRIVLSIRDLSGCRNVVVVCILLQQEVVILVTFCSPTKLSAKNQSISKTPRVGSTGPRAFAASAGQSMLYRR